MTTLSDEATKALRANPGINLPEQFVSTQDGSQRFSFEVDPFRKFCLVNGFDEIGLTLCHADKIREYEARRLAAQPWLSKTLAS